MMQRVRYDKIWGYEDWLYDDGKVLVKKICADSPLSVQVHPNEITAEIVGGKAKNEFWCILKSGPIYAGFRDGVTIADVAQAVEEGSIEKLLVKYEARAGECYFIPGGLVHTIGKGTSVFEVQQSSTTTFRFYDWGRIDANGNPRQLHINEAMSAMDISIKPPMPTDSVECEYFKFRKCAAGEISGSRSKRLYYDPIEDSLTVLEPQDALMLRRDAFEVTIPVD
ncbi:MAG: class I mannose-6-phosphate isomerase [Kiritimatiellae bacterium]|nr:class I mannose-6-phosphate isomerase [Kiritimatiellia bacterium]